MWDWSEQPWRLRRVSFPSVGDSTKVYSLFSNRRLSNQTLLKGLSTRHDWSRKVRLMAYSEDRAKVPYGPFLVVVSTSHAPSLCWLSAIIFLHKFSSTLYSQMTIDFNTQTWPRQTTVSPWLTSSGPVGLPCLAAWTEKLLQPPPSAMRWRNVIET